MFDKMTLADVSGTGLGRLVDSSSKDRFSSEGRVA